MAVDIIGPINNLYIITGIDYFTKKGYAKIINSSSNNKVREFIEEIYEQLPFKMLILDQSKENLSNKIKEFCKEKHIELHYTGPFHHQANGRVERFNRTLQELVYKNKVDKLLTIKVKKLLHVYNETYHTGIRMTPNEALTLTDTSTLKATQIEEIIKFNKSMRESLRKSGLKWVTW